jgi:hypothetical protein
LKGTVPSAIIAHPSSALEIIRRRLVTVGTGMSIGVATLTPLLAFASSTLNSRTFLTPTRAAPSGLSWQDAAYPRTFILVILVMSPIVV